MIQKVLHIIGGMDRGGTETMIMNLYRNIDRSKLQFDFLYLKDGNHHYDNEILDLGGRIFKIGAYYKKGPLSTIRKIITVIKENGPYIAVHSHVLHYSGITLLAASLARVKKRISHSHTTVNSKGNSLKRKIYYYVMKKLILRYSTCLAACSIAAGKFLYGDRFGESSKHIVIQNAIDLKHFCGLSESKKHAKRIELGIPENALVLGHVGNFRKVKNHKFLINLAERMYNDDIDFYLILVGDGDLRDEIEEKIIAKNLTEKIKLLGTRSDIPEIMNSIDIFLLPSIYEGLSLSVIEAQAAATPCILSDTITKELDMGVGLVSYLSLEDSLEVWVEEIISLSKKASVNKNRIFKSIIEKGYDVTTSAKNIYKLYTE